MKIGFVLDDGLNKPDGVQQYILTLGNWYRQHGHEVRYLVGETNRPDLEGVYSMARNVKVRFNGNALSIPLPTSSRKIKRVLNEEKFDVLHVQVPYSPFMGAKVIRYADKGTVVVGTFHILPYGWMSRIGTRLLGIWLSRNLKRFDAMASVSKPAAEFAKKAFKVESQVIPNSVPIEAFAQKNKQPNQDDSLKIVFLGRLVPRKGCQQLFKALAILKEKNQLPENMHIDIAGDGLLRDKLKAFAARKKFSDQVTFHGFVQNDHKIKLLQQADIAVFPSLSGESFGIVLIEAMAAGSGAVLAGTNPGYSSVLGELPDSMVDAYSPERFAAHLHELLTDKDRRRQLHIAQQNLVKQFDTEVVANRLLDLYETCKSHREK